MSKKHLYELDRLNLLFCLIVVFIHTFGGISNMFDHSSVYYIVSYSLLRNCAFVVQGFFFLSSLKFSMIYTDKDFNYAKFLFSRLKKILVPYVLTVVLYYICFYSLNYFNGFSLSELIKYIFNGTISAPFYFVIALIQFYILMPLWIVAVKKINGAFLFAISLIIFAIWSYRFAPFIDFNDKIFVSYLPYWFFGLAIGKNYSAVEQIMCKKRVKITALVLSAAAFMIFCYLDGYFYYTMMLRQMTGYYSHIIHLAFSFTAIIFTYCICNMFGNSNTCFFTKSINNVSYYIYLLHCLILTYADRFTTKLNLTRIYHVAIVRVIGVYAVIILISLAIYAIKSKKNIKNS